MQNIRRIQSNNGVKTMAIDWMNAILQGFFTGLGIATANWLHDKRIRKVLEKEEGITNKVKEKIKEWLK